MYDELERKKWNQHVSLPSIEKLMFLLVFFLFLRFSHTVAPLSAKYGL
jgi:hypothetical protein